MGTYAGDLQTLSLGLLVARVIIGFIMASGLLVAFGFLGPIGPALMISVMIVAAVTVHWEHGLFASNNGIELPLLYGAAAFAFALTGFGQYSLDHLFGIAGHLPITDTWIALLVGVLGGFANVALRRRPAVAQT